MLDTLLVPRKHLKQYPNPKTTPLQELAYDTFPNVPTVQPLTFHKTPPWLFNKVNFKRMHHLHVRESCAYIWWQQMVLHRHFSHHRLKQNSSSCNRPRHIHWQNYFKSSSYHGEAEAILKYLQIITQTHEENIKVCIDSHCTLRSINNPYTQQNTIKQIQDQTHKVSLVGQNILFIWVPRYIRFEGNKQANALPTTSDIKIIAKLKLCISRSTKWTNTTTNKILRQIKDDIESWSPRTNIREQVVRTRLMAYLDCSLCES